MPAGVLGAAEVPRVPRVLQAVGALQEEASRFHGVAWEEVSETGYFPPGSPLASFGGGHLQGDVLSNRSGREGPGFGALRGPGRRNQLLDFPAQAE